MSTTTDDVTRYLNHVTAACDDLPEQQRRALLVDLPGHLRDVAAAGSLVEQLGPPEQYAEELRAAAGLRTPAPAQRRRRGWWLVAGLTVALAVLVVGAWLVYSVSTPSDDTTPNGVVPPTPGPYSTSTHPAQQPLTIGRRGSGLTAPFRLAGGDYQARWTTRGDCRYSVTMSPGWIGKSDVFHAKSATSGTQFLYGVTRGKHRLDAITFQGHNCAWKVTFVQP